VKRPRLPQCAAVKRSSTYSLTAFEEVPVVEKEVLMCEIDVSYNNKNTCI